MQALRVQEFLETVSQPSFESLSNRLKACCRGQAKWYLRKQTGLSCSTEVPALRALSVSYLATLGLGVLICRMMEDEVDQSGVLSGFRCLCLYLLLTLEAAIPGVWAACLLPRQINKAAALHIVGVCVVCGVCGCVMCGV